MRVATTIDPRAPHRDFVRGDAGFWLGNRARSTWSVREREDSDGREVLVFEFSDPLDALDFSMRGAVSEHQGRIV